MKKNIQSIIKEAASRYGLKYDENQTRPSVQTPYGSKFITKEELSIAFNKTVPKIQGKWSEFPEEEYATWHNEISNNFEFEDNMHTFDIYTDRISA